jgi:hypothetical protein
MEPTLRLYKQAKCEKIPQAWVSRWPEISRMTSKFPNLCISYRSTFTEAQNEYDKHDKTAYGQKLRFKTTLMHSKRSWLYPKRPVRACVIAFLILSALFVVTVPFVQDIPRFEFLLVGLGYSSLLAVSSIGFLLLGERIGKPLLLSLSALGACLMLALLLPLRLWQDGVQVISTWVFPIAWLPALIFVAASLYGWSRHYRGIQGKEQIR